MLAQQTGPASRSDLITSAGSFHRVNRVSIEFHNYRRLAQDKVALSADSMISQRFLVTESRSCSDSGTREISSIVKAGTVRKFIK